jgi:prophage maintenance system killer protein
MSDNLLDTLIFIRQQGFSKEFIAVEEGLKEINEQKLYKPEELTILKVFRFEGSSDVDDMAVLYAIQTNDGLRGWISDAYGTYANSR